MIDSISDQADAEAGLKRAQRVERLPPHAPEMEQGVLGCCLLSPNDCLAQVMAVLREPDAMYDLRHQTILAALMRMSENNKPIDIITLQQRLKDLGLLDEIGGIPYLNELQDSVPSAANLSYYLEIVSEKHLLRKAIQTCTDIVGRVYDYQGDAETLLDEIERDVLAIRTIRGSVKQAVDTPQLVRTAMTEIQAKAESNGALTGLATGFLDLDYYTDGLQPGDMTVIAAYPSTGKTALAINIAENVVLNLGLPVGVFSLEMTSVALVKRCLCSTARVNLRDVGAGDLVESDLPKLIMAASRLSRASIYFDDTSDLSIYELRGKARRMWQQYGIKLFVVDYLQLLNASGGPRKIENRQQEVADISSGIKNMAKELGVPVLVLSQLNDDGKLRESRAIGQDADGVWMLEEKDDEHKLWIRKQRNGPRNVCVNLTFLKEFTRFESAAKVSDEDMPPQPELNGQPEFRQ